MAPVIHLRLRLDLPQVDSLWRLKRASSNRRKSSLFNSIHGLSPPYISELITVKPKSTYGLRSNNSTLLLPPTQKMLPTLGARSFVAAAPALWNKLPADIRNVVSLNSLRN